MAGDRHAIRDDAARQAWALKKLSSGCQVCGTRKPDWRGFSVHHLLPGRCGRSDEPTNYLLACGQCHDLMENRTIRDDNGLVIPTIPLGMALTIKLVRDQEDWNPNRLRVLSGERLPYLELPHPWIELAYFRNRPSPFRPYVDEMDIIVANINEWIDAYEILR